MIVYDLACICGCQFEGWFKDRADFDNQNKEELICCPVCEGCKINKILSPVAVKTSSSESRLASVGDSSEAKMALRLLKNLNDYVKDNFEDVGPKLANEALKIHFGVEESRNIRGVATAQEEKMLKDEGVELLKVPLLDDDIEEKSN